MRFAQRALFSALALMMLCYAVSAQTLRSPNDPRNQSPSVGTGGPVGGPTGLFTIYDGSTLRRGEYTFSLAYSNYDRDPGNVDLTIVPGSFNVGLNDYVELFYSMDLYRGIKVNTPQNLSSFYLPNSQFSFVPGVFGSGPAIILAPDGPNVGSIRNTAVFRPALCTNANCAQFLSSLPTNIFPTGFPTAYRSAGQPFVQFPFVGGPGPNFTLGPNNFPGFSSLLSAPRAAPNSGNFGPADVFPGIGSPVGGILPGIVLATTLLPPGNVFNNLVVPATYTVAPAYLPDAPFINRTYGQSSFSQASVGAKIRLTSPNNALGVGMIPFYRFYLDKADDASGFNQLQRGSGAGSDIGDFGLIGFIDGRLSRSVNVSANLGYILNSNPKGQFPTGEFTLLDRPDEVIAGIGFDFPVNKYFQPVLEVRSTQYVGGRTPNAFENSPVEALAGVKIYPRRWFGMGFAYRYHANQQDRDSFEARDFASTVNVATGPAVTVSATTGGFPRGFIPSNDPHGFIGQFWIGRRNARTIPPPANQPPTVDLNVNPSTVSLRTACPEGQESSGTCTSDSQVALRTSASDPENDVLLYSYTTTGGRIVGDGANVTWDLSGVQPGTYRANVYVKDGQPFHEVTDFVTITVTECNDCRPKPLPTPPPCPPLSLDGPTNIIEPGQRATITARAGGSPVSNYRWSVSCGTILSGDGTQAISVDTSTCEARSVTVNLTVEGGDFRPECTSSASTTYEVGQRPGPIKFDEFTPISPKNFNDDKARLDNFAIRLQQDQSTQAYIIAFGTCGTEGTARAKRQRDYLISDGGVAANRITIIDGGCRDSLLFQFYIAPQGVPAPAAEGGSPCAPCRRGRVRRDDEEDED